MADEPPKQLPEKPDVIENPPVVDSRELFAGKDEIWIDHAGERYRLRITRRGKLILQK